MVFKSDTNLKEDQGQGFHFTGIMLLGAYIGADFCT